MRAGDPVRQRPQPNQRRGRQQHPGRHYVSVQQLGDLRQEFSEYSNSDGGTCDTCGDPASNPEIPLG